MSACPYAERLEQLLSEQLSAAEEDTVSQHVERCPTCQQHLEQLTHPLRPLGRKSKPEAQLPPAFLVRLQEASWADSVNKAVQDTHSTSSTLGAPPREGLTENTWPVVHGYEILGELGRGGMGVVYRARQRGVNRIVALKMILDGAHASAEHRARFRREAEAVGRLQHANIVQVYDVGEQD